MEARELLRGQFKQFHEFIEGTMSDVTREIADRVIEGAPIGTIGHTYGHLVLLADLLVGERLGATALDRDGWGERLGVSAANHMQDAEWTARSIDLAAFREYAKAVFANIDTLLANTTDAELMKDLDTPAGKMPVITFISNIGLAHTVEHWGEIAALKGVHGMKGPY